MYTITRGTLSLTIYFSELSKDDHHRRLLVSVWNSTQAEKELLGRMSFGVRNIVCGKRVSRKMFLFTISLNKNSKHLCNTQLMSHFVLFQTINGWYYLLKDEVGQRKHLQAVSRKGHKVRGQS